MSEFYEIVDPIPLAKEAPFTFFLPDTELIAAVKSGDLIKAIFRSRPPSENYDAERMWVIVTVVGSDWFEGTLDNNPADMPSLKLGSIVRVPKSAVTQVDLQGSGRVPPKTDEVREYWERCLVDKLVTDGTKKIGFLYKEEPDMTRDGDQYPDSGWRIRADDRGCTDEEIDARDLEYVAIGRVLNADASWLHLVDEPIGVVFDKDFERDVFVRRTDGS